MKGDSIAGRGGVCIRKIVHRLIPLSFCLCLAALLFYFSYSPRCYFFHSNISPVHGLASGKVYKSAAGAFLVRLDSGQQLSIEPDLAKIRMRRTSIPVGLQIGPCLFVSQHDLAGVDLSNTEKLDRQWPVVKDGKILLTNPMSPGVSFTFPVAGP